MGTVPCLSLSTKCNIPNITQLVAELQWRSPATDLSPEMLLCTKKAQINSQFPFPEADGSVGRHNGGHGQSTARAWTDPRQTVGKRSLT